MVRWPAPSQGKVVFRHCPKMVEDGEGCVENVEVIWRLRRACSCKKLESALSFDARQREIAGLHALCSKQEMLSS